MVDTLGLRRWLVRLVTESGDPRLAGVTVDTHFPGDRNLAPAMVFCGRFTPTEGTSVREMRAGAKNYHHAVAMEVMVQVRGKVTPADCEERATGIYAAVAELVAENVVPRDETSTPLAYDAVLGDWTLQADWTDAGAAAEITTSILFHIDS